MFWGLGACCVGKGGGKGDVGVFVTPSQPQRSHLGEARCIQKHETASGKITQNKCYFVIILFLSAHDLTLSSGNSGQTRHTHAALVTLLTQL